jgi:CRISPR system Cascade subunit CasC
MKSLLEMHILQNFAPSNLNRDDTGSPKDAMFGGYRRARISSQCFKRAIRREFASDPLVADEDRAVRTRLLIRHLADKLVERSRPPDQAAAVAQVALGGLKITPDVKNPERTQYLIFLGQREIARIAELIDRHWDGLVTAAASKSDEGKKGSKKAKKSARGAVPEDLVTAIGKALDGGKAVDVALFGRMLADIPEKNQDAACQVAHAISTHKVEREFDFYTAVDDLNPAEETGAGMMGTVEFNSACFYRYAAVDLAKLVDNLQGDKDLAVKAVEAFLRASLFALPSGKQNTFAAHNPPSFAAFAVRKDAAPRSLANAFETGLAQVAIVDRYGGGRAHCR